MALLKILCFPDERLRNKAKPVKKVSSAHQRLLDDMLETMYDAPGIGLAATQVNVHERLIVIDISEDKNEPYCLINPEIISDSGKETMEEGCLSVPDTYAEVERADTVSVKYLDRKGNEKILETDGLLAVCLQHEIDHLQGKLFVDYLSKLKRERIRKKLEKQKRQAM
ncbi:MAG: peptide deformylase [Gammaproteobacteria bacterium]|nr:MAG: peptide deformylase [Gammaproteobacteria bacterium]